MQELKTALAKGHMADEELTAALSELDEVRETAERELESVHEPGKRRRTVWSATRTPSWSPTREWSERPWRI